MNSREEKRINRSKKIRKFCLPSYAIDVICGVSDLFECEVGELEGLWKMARMCGYNVTTINIEHLQTF